MTALNIIGWVLAALMAGISLVSWFFFAICLLPKGERTFEFTMLLLGIFTAIVATFQVDTLLTQR